MALTNRILVTSVLVIGTQFMSNTIIGISAQADQEIDPVPMQLLDLVFGPENEKTRFYQDIPESFPKFELPAELEVIVTADLGAVSELFLETRLGRDETVAALINAFVNQQGWSSYQYPNTKSTERGVVISDDGEMAHGYLCHATAPPVDIKAYSEGGSTIARVTSYRAGNHDTCDRIISRIAGQSGRETIRGSLEQHLPLLEIPGEIVEGGQRSTAWSATGDIEAKVSYQLSITWSISQLYEHFAEQMQQQNWQLDGQWSGDVSVGGVWKLTPEPGQQLLAYIDIVENSNLSYKIGFRILRHL